ncbi:uncharacterized protein [Branchiostoma lanceolatum]|uniref:uncharacterized protein n=1 Tax=Branchiostoma lanceolatum TaxID=7740 RepID=UPI00345353E3
MFGKMWVLTLVVTVLVATMGTEGIRVRKPTKPKNNQQKTATATASTKDLPHVREIGLLDARVRSLESTVGRLSRTLGQIGLKMKQTESRDRADPSVVRRMSERVERMMNRLEQLDEWRERQENAESSDVNAGGQSNDNDEEPGINGPLDAPVFPRPVSELVPAVEGGVANQDQEDGLDGGNREDGDQSQAGYLNEGGGGEDHIPMPNRFNPSLAIHPDPGSGPQPNPGPGPLPNPSLGIHPNPEPAEDSDGDDNGQADGPDMPGASFSGMVNRFPGPQVDPPLSHSEIPEEEEEPEGEEEGTHMGPGPFSFGGMTLGGRGRPMGFPG